MCLVFEYDRTVSVKATKIRKGVGIMPTSFLYTYGINAVGV